MYLPESFTIMKTNISSTGKRKAVNMNFTLFGPFPGTLFTLFLALLGCSFSLPAQDRTEKYFMGIELNGTLCGYSEVFVTPPQADSVNYIAMDYKTFLSFRAIGREVSQKQLFTYHIDTADGNFIYHDSYMEQGEQQMAAAMTVVDDSLILQPDGQAATAVYLPENTLLPNTMFFPHLQRDFGSEGLDSVSYRIFNVRNGRVEDIVYRKVGDEPIELNGTSYQAVIVQERDPGTGLLTTLWIDKDSGLRLQMESRNSIRIYLTDPLVMTRLSTGNADDLIFVRTNEWIWDLRSISSMKVLADLEAFPGPGMEDLNVPGQSFEGSITGNSVKGSFEVEHCLYRGEGALPFGESHTFKEDMDRYLQPEELIQSEDPEIKELALRITEGSKDFWEAACRLSSWVADSIGGSINGGSALETLQRGDGACGAQSVLLAALCRASGIPARVAWGCVYTPEYGGSFGHHGWNEIYVGEAGWIPVDATFHEKDYVDSGHIRLGELNTQYTVINFREVKILSYAVR
jgi:transglutaminase-like putative cysteine protease